MKWTEKEEKYLRENHLIKTVPEMCADLGRTESSINARRAKLELKRPESIKQEMQARGYFKKGVIPFNKGVKGVHMSPDTEFKKGHEPKNTKYNGCVTLREHRRTGMSYLFIRIEKNNWKMLHHYNWEKVYGKIPKGHLIRFVNGNTLDCNIENLELVSQADNARRNADHKKAAETLRNRYLNDFDSMYPPSRIASFLSYKDANLREKLLMHPEIIEVKRNQLKLKRELKNATIL